MKKYVFESLKFFCAAILCTILSAFTTPALADLDPCRNLFDPSTAELGDISSATGGISSSVQYRIVSGLIPVTPGETYTASGKIYNTGTGLHDVMIIRAYYDSGQRFIADSRTMSDATFTIPSGVSYVRVEYWTGENGTAVIAQSQLQFEQGSTATAYTPYNPLCATCNGTIVNYVSATGTVSQDGTPTPDNPIEPTFYKQGDMVLRKVGDIADSYDATTGKITRRVGVAVLDGTERWGSHTSNTGWFQLAGDIFPTDVNASALSTHYMQYTHNPSGMANQDILFGRPDSNTGRVVIRDAINFPDVGLVGDFKSWLAQQYAAGTPVTVWYPLAEPVEEDWTETSYCETPIKIATTKYNETAFGPLNTALANAISVVDTVVSNTITQAASIATLQTQKQTRPNDIADDSEKCPAGKKCLLVEDASGVPHWYEIVENAYGLPSGYTALEYVESRVSPTEAYIDTGLNFNSNYMYEITYAKGGLANVFMGARSNSDYLAVGNFSLTYNTSTCVYSSTSTNSTSVNFEDTTFGIKHTVKYQQSTSTLLFDDTNKWDSNWVTHTEIPFNVYLFAFNLGGTPGGARTEYARIYTYSVKNSNDTFVQNFVPAKNSAGVIGMYDTVNNRFYTNAGSGTFVAGPVSE